MMLLIISTAAFAAYITTMIALFGIPESISETYYLLEHRCGKNNGWIFTIFCWIVVFTLLPFWLEYSHENTQFLAFLSGAGLLFVGTAPQFKDVGLSRTVHFAAAFVCAAASISWLCFTNMWTYPLITLLIACFISILNRTKWLFWIELAAFAATYLALFINN